MGALSRLLPIVILLVIVYTSALRIGKIVKTYKTSAQKMSANQKMSTIVGQLRLSVGPSEELDLEKFIKENVITGDLADVSKDPWGQSYRLERRNSLLVILSGGPDGVFGTEDDLTATAEMLPQ